MLNSKVLYQIGWVLVILISCLTPFLVRNIKSANKNIIVKDYIEGIEGKTGILTETYENRQIVLEYDSIFTRSSEIQINPARVRFEDQFGKWLIEGSSATRRNNEWIIIGPVRLTFKDRNNFIIGEGTISGSIPCLLWSQGSWQGLAPLNWTSMTGLFTGVWTLPEGWSRNNAGVFKSKKLPTIFDGNNLTDKNIKSLQVDEIESKGDFKELLLTKIKSDLLLGKLITNKAIANSNQINFPEVVSFERKNEILLMSNNAYYSDVGESSVLDLYTVNGSRLIDTFRESISSKNASVYLDGSRFSGNVEWVQISKSNTTRINSPEIYIRERQGTSLPNDILIDEIVSPKSTEVLIDDLKFFADTLRFNKKTFNWSIGPTVNGQSKDGFYKGGVASGNRDVWTMQGPIIYELNNSQGVLRGSSLKVTKAEWILTGEPLIWQRGTDKVTSSKIIKGSDIIKFSDQLNGVFIEQDRAITVDAKNGYFKNNKMFLSGPVTLNGIGWSCSALEALISFDPSRKISLITLNGDVSLSGKLGEGSGDRLEIKPKLKDKNYTIHWEGRVKGKSKAYD